MTMPGKSELKSTHRGRVVSRLMAARPPRAAPAVLLGRCPERWLRWQALGSRARLDVRRVQAGFREAGGRMPFAGSERRNPRRGGRLRARRPPTTTLHAPAPRAR